MHPPHDIASSLLSANHQVGQLKKEMDSGKMLYNNDVIRGLDLQYSNNSLTEIFQDLFAIKNCRVCPDHQPMGKSHTKTELIFTAALCKLQKVCLGELLGTCDHKSNKGDK